MNELQKAAAILGEKGGKSGTGSAKARTTEVARAAAMKRWLNPEGIRERFWAKVQKGGPDQCWPWIGSRDSKGYGRVRLLGKCRNASRVAFCLEYGDLDEAKQVCHKCDNPPCVNPNHLFEGTRSENIQDCIKKGRFPSKVGSKNGHTKFDEATVLEIRKQVADGTATMAALARQHGVDHECIRMIVKRIKWKHI